MNGGTRTGLRGRIATGDRIAIWQCYACLTKNDAHVKKCEACGARKVPA